MTIDEKVEAFESLSREQKLDILAEAILQARSVQAVVSAETFELGLANACEQYAEGWQWDVAVVRLQLEKLSNHGLVLKASQTFAQHAEAVSRLSLT